MTAIRLPVSFALALCTTATLFWFLGVLTAVDPHATIIPITTGIDFTIKIPETETVIRDHIRQPIPKPELPPETPVVTVDRSNVDLIDGIDGPSSFQEGIRESLNVPEAAGPRKFTMRTGSDRGPVPQVRIPPDYPPGPKDRGIEGWITVRFTVAIDGSVKDVAIVDSQPPHVWDSATLRAVSSWRYQPAMKDGKPVAQAGVTVTYRFELDR